MDLDMFDDTLSVDDDSDGFSPEKPVCFPVLHEQRRSILWR